jgi:hypothetical protein
MTKNELDSIRKYFWNYKHRENYDHEIYEMGVALICHIDEQNASDKVNESEKTAMLEWVATIRYDRGLGIEYRNLPDIQATNLEAAKEEACKVAAQILGDVDVKEMKLRPKG